MIDYVHLVCVPVSPKGQSMPGFHPVEVSGQSKLVLKYAGIGRDATAWPKTEGGAGPGWSDRDVPYTDYREDRAAWDVDPRVGWRQRLNRVGIDNLADESCLLLPGQVRS